MDVRTMFPCDVSSVRLARTMVRGELAAHTTAVSPELVDAASLLLSELVTNAIVHARTDVEVHLVTDDHMLRAEVSDGDATMPLRPSPRRPALMTGTGRGLQLIDELASRWGVSSSAAGKTVWFELLFSANV